VPADIADLETTVVNLGHNLAIYKRKELRCFVDIVDHTALLERLVSCGQSSLG